LLDPLRNERVNQMNTDETVLFLCAANSALSQIAAGLARKLFGTRLTVQRRE